MIRKRTLALSAIVLSGQMSLAQEASQREASNMGDERMNSWAEYVEGLGPLGEKFRSQLSDPGDEQLVQELYRHMYLLLSQGYGGLMYQNADHPDFWPQFSTMYNYAIDNADDTYYTTPINPDGVYKITGFRGTARIVDFQVGSEHFFYTGLGKLGPPLANYDLDHEVTINEDGSFEFILSQERPEGYNDDWLALDPKATHLFVRQVFYDWENEVTGRYSIERLDVPAVRPRPAAEHLATQLSKMTQVTHNWMQFALDHSANLRARGVVNKIAVRDFSNAGGVSTQIYMDGLYDLTADEALIIEMEIPKDCFYWSLVIYDELWSIVDWMHRQSSINGHSAVTGTDGVFRAVVSSKDPGVPNWLDTADYRRGGLFGRFNRCPSELTPKTKKIPFAEIRAHLPADTPTVSPEERGETIRARRRSIQLRRRW